MEYEKKYKESLAMARDYYKANLKLNKADENLILEDIFPELKESEDEREELINYLKGIRFVTVESAEKVRNWIVWLEKQGDNLVKNGYTNNKNYIRYADKYSYEIWRKLMDNFKNIKDYHIGCNDVSEIVLNAIIDTFNWLEKGGDKNKVSQHVEAINEEKVDTANKVEPTDYSSIDPHFFKTTDKVEPKFKVGDWITDGCLHCKISDVLDDRYIVDTKFGKRSAITFNRENNYHLWSIQDAKSGDILAESKDGVILIFRGIGNAKWNDVIDYHCHYNCNREEFIIQKDLKFWGHVDDTQLKPATKVQRDLLFQKMREAGYDWDAEKLELKKIKFNPDDLIEESYQQQADDLIDMITEKPTLLGVKKMNAICKK